MARSDQWVSEPNSPWRIAEAVGRSLLAIGVWMVVLYAIVAVASASVEWFAGIGVAAPLFWFGDRLLPTAGCG